MSETSGTSKGRKIGYWVVTGFIALGTAASGVVSLIGPPDLVAAYEHLGMPTHLMILIGVAKLLAVVTIVVPGFARLKEWAYAGLVIDFVGAAWIHAFTGDAIEDIVAPLVLAALALTSWALRPAERRLA